MVDDRHEAYRQMYTRTYIRETLENIKDTQDIADLVYDTIELALHTEYKWPHPTVSQVLQEVLEKKGRMI